MSKKLSAKLVIFLLLFSGDVAREGIVGLKQNMLPKSLELCAAPRELPLEVFLCKFASAVWVALARSN